MAPAARLRAVAALVAALALGPPAGAELPNLQDPKVQYELGMSQLLGRDVPQNPTEGIAWLRKAAAQGYGDAEVQLGICYQQGLGVEKDPAQAFAWFRRAAERKDPRGELQVGLAYRRGTGVAPDLKQAVEYLGRAAEQGLPKAQLELGLAYRDGLTGPPDPEQAAFWLSLAARRGSFVARPVAVAALGQLDPEQRARVEARSTAWLAAHPARPEPR